VQSLDGARQTVKIRSGTGELVTEWFVSVAIGVRVITPIHG